MVVAGRQVCVCAVSGVVPAGVFQLGVWFLACCCALSAGVYMVLVVAVTFGITFTSVFSVVVSCCGVPPGATNSASDVAMVLSSLRLDFFGRFCTASLSSLCNSSACCSGENVGKMQCCRKRSKDPDVRYDLVSGT